MAISIDINNATVSDAQLVSRSDIAKFLGIGETRWDTLVRKGYAPSKVTPQGVWPRWKVGDIRTFKDKFTKNGLLVPMRSLPTSMTDPNVKDEDLISRTALAKHFNVTPSAWSNWVSAGKAPQPVTPEGAFPKWRVGDIKEWFKL